ncbi:MAG: hypothetical protein K8R77_11965 [Anaerolineaceae bacterium]|nr:hypothetical protein [Anaerolineaceae bacterium]
MTLSACAATPVAAATSQAALPANESNPQEIQATEPAPPVEPVATMETQSMTTEDHSEGFDCPICEQVDLTDYNGPLTAEEIEGLLLALNDEYHAWAVYDQVLQDHGDVNPFASIRGSEATYIGALIVLFNTYGVPVPENTWIGNVPSFASAVEACETGVEAEILNRDLYTRLFDTTERQDIISVYEALQQASDQKHLPAFERCSTSGGGAGQGKNSV